MSFKKITSFILSLSLVCMTCAGVTFAADVPKSLIPLGYTAGIRLHSDGALIVSMSDDGFSGWKNPSEAAGLKVNDVITSLDGHHVDGINDVMEYMAKSDGADITVKYKRENEEHIATISPAWSDGDDMYKIGLVIRDSTAGIGTLTYLDPENGSFGGLGHGIQDADTGKLFDTEDGNVSDVMITGIVKGYKDKAGEIQGMFLEDAEEIGSLRKNTEYGIFGTIAKDSDFLNLKQYEQADASEIKEGAAYILTDLISGTPEMYDMQIERVYNSKVKNTKNMLIRITDERIINKTGGIIQGMGVIDNRDNTKKPENKGFSTVTLKLPSTLVSDPHRHIRIDDPL